MNATSSAVTAGPFEVFWRHVVANYTEHQISAWGAFWLHSAVYTILTCVSVGLSCVRALDKYKIQPGKPVTREGIIQCLKLVWFTHIVVEGPLFYFFLPWYMHVTNTPFDYDTIPSWTTYVWKMALCLVTEDAWHYFCHRALHHPSIYGHIHKVHHTYTAPFGIVAEYAHPVETLVLGIGFFIPILTICDHMLFMFVWFLVRQVQTHEAHIGYSFPLNPLYAIPFYGGGDSHDLHHKKFNCNFSSTFTYWDRICGTFVDPKPTLPKAAFWSAPADTLTSEPVSPRGTKTE